ncbi:5-formyltetrahydrofolate cyclo-ligase [Lentinula aff. lateritia]|uniref:5-formyltetrahydrofolate cyclo-ligase n=1 Tax=Lentinula aff. lateritia TaxID=2804960 RepID=A0ACC1TMA6_9AGAR|nr:5-formyltetrahydrofolate cyclo-ligase [Lentinula aff. lateritia]
MLPTLHKQKGALRKSIYAVVRSLDNIKEQSRAVTAKVLLLPEFQKCTRVSCYISMPTGELQTSEILRAILETGNKSLFVPKVNQDGAMEFLKVESQSDLDALPSGKWGIREPSYELDAGLRVNAMEAGLDLILVPGVAFDRSMSRLGHGKGYYDRYIARYIASGRPRPLLVLVALGLRDQLLESTIPVEEHDFKMDMIIMPEEVIHR